MVKERVYLNRVAVEHEALFAGAKDYFDRHGVKIDFEFVQSDYQNLGYVIRQFPQGERVILQPSMSEIVPIDPAYDFTSFMFNQAEFAPPYLPTSYCYSTSLSGLQPFMDLGTHPENPRDLDYVNICHEHMHALVIKARQSGFDVPDVMDTYYNHMQLEDADSNFGQQWILLQNYINSLKIKIPNKKQIPRAVKPEGKKDKPKKLLRTKKSKK